MTTAARFRTRFFEGSNVATTVLVPVLFGLSVWYYPKIVEYVVPLKIQIEDVYTYTFNLFAVELGALLALFALFACRPTPFLERMKNTTVFSAIVANTNIALVLAVVALIFTCALGLVRFTPDLTLTGKSYVFLLWFWIVAATMTVYIRTVRLILTALA